MASARLPFHLVNKTGTDTLYAYVTGYDPDNRQWILQADGSTKYYPSANAAPGSPIPVDCNIIVGAKGKTKTLTIGIVISGRVWFSQNAKLKFFQNPSRIVDPCVETTTDKNYYTHWDFIEFNNTAGNFFANISYVDFFSIPITLDLATNSGNQHVSGTNEDGLATVVKKLKAEANSSNIPWDDLIVHEKNSNDLLRVLSLNTFVSQGKKSLSSVLDDYINKVWSQYKQDTITINTQATAGNVTGQVGSSGFMKFSDGYSFAKPTTDDVWSNSSGPFAPVNPDRDTITARLCASFNRRLLTLPGVSQFPNGTKPSEYYKQAGPTNSYAEIVHEVNLDGLGYAFPFDDVTPDGQREVSGKVTDPAPNSFTITVGWRGAHK